MAVGCLTVGSVRRTKQFSHSLDLASVTMGTMALSAILWRCVLGHVRDENGRWYEKFIPYDWNCDTYFVLGCSSLIAAGIGVYVGMPFRPSIWRHWACMMLTVLWLVLSQMMHGID